MQNKPKSKAVAAKSSNALTADRRNRSPKNFHLSLPELTAKKAMYSLLRAQVVNQRNIRAAIGTYTEDRVYKYQDFMYDVLAQEELYVFLKELATLTLLDDLKVISQALNVYLKENPDKLRLQKVLINLVCLSKIVLEDTELISAKIQEMSYLKELINNPLNSL